MLIVPKLDGDHEHRLGWSELRLAVARKVRAACPPHRWGMLCVMEVLRRRF